MPYADRTCEVCGEFVKSNNFARHMKRWHNDSDEDDASPSRGRSKGSDRRSSNGDRQSSRDDPSTDRQISCVPSPSSDYVKDAVLCMMRRVEAVNIPSLSSYLAMHFSEIPPAWRTPIIVATFTAAQKAAATHGDAVLDADQARSTWVKQSLVRWAHGLSAVEPGHMSSTIRLPRSRDSSTSRRNVNAYSPSTNYLVERELPVPATSNFLKKQFDAKYIHEQTSCRENLSDPSPPVNDNLDVEPPHSDENSSTMSNGGSSCQELCTSVAISNIHASFPSMIESTSEVNQPTRPAEALVSTSSTPPSTFDESVHTDHPATLESDNDTLSRTVLSTPNILKSSELQLSMPESFADLLQVHGADADLLQELNRPLSVCLSPLLTPFSSPKQQEEPVLEVCASPQPSLEGDVLTPKAVSSDKTSTANRVSLPAGMRRKKKSTGSPSSSSSDVHVTELPRGSTEGTERQGADKENQKKRSATDETSEPERRAHPGSPKRAKVHPTSGSETTTLTESSTDSNANFKIPFRKSNDGWSHRRDNRTSTLKPPNADRRDKDHYERFGYNNRHRFDVDRSHTNRRLFDGPGHRRESDVSLTPDQQRWLARMPKHWR